VYEYYIRTHTLDICTHTHTYMSLYYMHVLAHGLSQDYTHTHTYIYIHVYVYPSSSSSSFIHSSIRINLLPDCLLLNIRTRKQRVLVLSQSRLFRPRRKTNSRKVSALRHVSSSSSSPTFSHLLIVNKLSLFMYPPPHILKSQCLSHAQYLPTPRHLCVEKRAPKKKMNLSEISVRALCYFVFFFIRIVSVHLSRSLSSKIQSVFSRNKKARAFFRGQKRSTYYYSGRESVIEKRSEHFHFPAIPATFSVSRNPHPLFLSFSLSLRNRSSWSCSRSLN